MADLKIYRPKRQTYSVIWRWSHTDPDGYSFGGWYAEYEATTAPRAINMLKKELSNEYSFEPGELIIVSASPKYL